MPAKTAAITFQPTIPNLGPPKVGHTYLQESTALEYWLNSEVLERVKFDYLFSLNGMSGVDDILELMWAERGPSLCFFSGHSVKHPRADADVGKTSG
ncbi:hypothetical protein C0Q70_04173 [Pomacea canaliculata]|uniref:Uncharacterized protein n=1 Tax=Pomacea canaliculata TaxID=400727 RepID=A0A2T7PUT5_POMCA|nr:hypothetical protein C0Q70_04173 [Pomacea canaliculata]